MSRNRSLSCLMPHHSCRAAKPRPAEIVSPPVPVSSGRSCIVARKARAERVTAPCAESSKHTGGASPLKRFIVAAAVIAALAASAQQQPQNPAPQPAGEIPKLTETIDIRVINMDVVVTDKKGMPVTGLKKEDFEIYENGVLKPISNFYEVEASHGMTVKVSETAAAPAPEPAKPVRIEDIPENQKRRIIFYVDNLSMAPFNRNRVFKQMKDFVEKVMRPGDEAMVATYNRSMKVRVPFTRDPVQIQQTLDVIAGESAMGNSNRSERKQTEDQIRDARSYDEALATARTYSESVMHDLRQSQ